MAVLSIPPELIGAMVSASGLWPSEVAALQATALAFHACTTAEAARTWRESADKSQALRKIEKEVGTVSAEHMVSCRSWPQWQDAFVWLKWCGCDLGRLGNPLRFALAAGNMRFVEWLVDAGVELEDAVEADLTPLRWAVRNGNEELVRLLLSNGANVNAQGAKSDCSALMTAAIYGHIRIARILLQAGADVSLTDVEGQTAIDLAHGYPEFVDLLEQCE